MSCSLSVKFAVGLIFLGFLLQTFVFEDYFRVKDLIWNSTKAYYLNKPSYDIIIGVLSARHHFELRKSLRETWVGYVKHNEHLKNRLLIKFIVGKEACLIPVQDRQDPYSCEKSDLTFNPVLNQDITAYQVPEGTVGNHVHPGPIGMDFKNLHHATMSQHHIEKIASLTEDLRLGIRRNENEIKSNKEIISSLEKELREGRSNENSLKEKIRSLEREIQDLKDKNERLVKQLRDMEVKIQELERTKKQEDSVLVIGQISTSTQRNLCKYVLREHFKENSYYKFKDIDKYIDNLENQADQEAAKERLDELKGKISWDQSLVDSLKNLNQARTGIAHPDLSSEKIQEATNYLKDEKKLNKGMVDIVNKLKQLWETSKVLLQTSSADGQDGSRVVPVEGQKYGLNLRGKVRHVNGLAHSALPSKKARGSRYR